MDRIKKITRFIIDPYILWGKFYYWCIKELIKLIRHNPIKTLIVICITSVITIIVVTLLNDEQFLFIPNWVRITTIWIIGIGAFMGSLTWSIMHIQD